MQELQEHSIPYIGGEQWKEPYMETAEHVKDLKIDEDIGAVVVGFDQNLSYSRIVSCVGQAPA